MDNIGLVDVRTIMILILYKLILIYQYFIVC